MVDETTCTHQTIEVRRSAALPTALLEGARLRILREVWRATKAVSRAPKTGDRRIRDPRPRARFCRPLSQESIESVCPKPAGRRPRLPPAAESARHAEDKRVAPLPEVRCTWRRARTAPLRKMVGPRSCRRKDRHCSELTAWARQASVSHFDVRVPTGRLSRSWSLRYRTSAATVGLVKLNAKGRDPSDV